MRTFLRQTAVLDRLCAPLCDAVTRRNDSASHLAHLEQHNLFLIAGQPAHLVSLPSSAGRLPALLDEAEQVQLHRRAAAWCAANDDPAAAVRHALASGDMVFAADTMAAVIQRGGLVRWWPG
ncbi:MAG: hypothetical protein R2851_15935 [Caldilineaceae bacterium]